MVNTFAVSSGPRYLAVHPGGSVLHVTNWGGNSVSAINTTTNIITNIPVGVHPWGIVVNPAGTRVYVANSSANTISVIDTATNTVINSIAVPGSVLGMVFHPGGALFYVVDNNILSVVSTATNTVINTIPVQNNASSLAINAAGTKVYVGCAGNCTSLSIVDVASNAVTSVNINTASPGLAMHPAGTFLYTANYDGMVSAINTATNTVAANIIVSPLSAGGPISVAVHPNGQKVYVGNFATANDVSVIDTATNTLSTSIAVGSSPSVIAFKPGHRAAYVAQMTGNVLALDPVNSSIAAGIALNYSYSVAYGVVVNPAGSRAYVTAMRPCLKPAIWRSSTRQPSP